jgi:hypothetical protein
LSRAKSVQKFYEDRVSQFPTALAKHFAPSALHREQNALALHCAQLTREAQSFSPCFLIPKACDICPRNSISHLARLQIMSTVVKK